MKPKTPGEQVGQAIRPALILLLATHTLLAQGLLLSQGGIVNSASWSSPVAPGSLISIFGTGLAPSPQSATPPLPFSLGGVTVTVNGVPAPLSFVSPTQINAQVPAATPAPGSLTGPVISTATVVITNGAGFVGTELVGVTAGAPGLFSADGSGCLQAAALNTAPDGTVSANSYSHSAQPGDYLSLFGTGFGAALQQPADGAVSTASLLQRAPGLFLDNAPISPSYAGLAPGLVGVNQINFQIPETARNGCSVPVSASQGLGSPSVTVSIQRGRGQCTDPPTQSWGQLALSKGVFSLPGPAVIPPAEFFTASFPSGPNVQPAADQIVYAPNFASGAAGGIAIFSSVPINPRTCPIPGYTNLSAGAIQVQPPAGSAVTAQPLPLQSGGVTYTQSLPAGFIGPGRYTVAGASDGQVSLAAGITVGSPIQIQTALTPGTVISSFQPLTIRWTGGDLGTLVRLSLTSGTSSIYSYAETGSGVLTIYPLCSGGPTPGARFCSFLLPLSQTAQVTVQVLPAPDQVETVSLPGVTGPVKLTWQYSWNFSGLALTE